MTTVVKNSKYQNQLRINSFTQPFPKTKKGANILVFALKQIFLYCTIIVHELFVVSDFC